MNVYGVFIELIIKINDVPLGIDVDVVIVTVIILLEIILYSYLHCVTLAIFKEQDLDDVSHSISLGNVNSILESVNISFKLVNVYFINTLL